MGWNELCIWKKKKNDGFWTNRGFENIRDYIGKKAEKSWGWNELCNWKKKKNDGFWTNRGFEI